VQETIRNVEKEYVRDDLPQFGPGDTVSVSMKIREGNKERVQAFQGTVIQQRGSGLGKTFTVRKASGNVYVEKIFPWNSPLITEIKLKRRGRVRRSKLYYLRGRTGKATRVREKR